MKEIKITFDDCAENFRTVIYDLTGYFTINGNEMTVAYEVEDSVRTRRVKDIFFNEDTEPYKDLIEKELKRSHNQKL